MRGVVKTGTRTLFTSLFGGEMLDTQEIIGKRLNDIPETYWLKSRVYVHGSSRGYSGKVISTPQKGSRVLIEADNAPGYVLPKWVEATKVEFLG